MAHRIHYHHRHKQIRGKIITIIIIAPDQEWTVGDQWMRMIAHLMQVQRITHDRILKLNNKRDSLFLWTSCLDTWITSTISQGMRSKRILYLCRRSVSRWRTSQWREIASTSNLILVRSHPHRDLQAEWIVVLH